MKETERETFIKLVGMPGQRLARFSAGVSGYVGQKGWFHLSEASVRERIANLKRAHRPSEQSEKALAALLADKAKARRAS